MARPRTVFPRDSGLQFRMLLTLVLLGLLYAVFVAVLFALWLVLSGLERVLIEFIRRNDRVALGLTVPQLLSIVLLVAGSVWLLRAERPLAPPATG